MNITCVYMWQNTVHTPYWSVQQYFIGKCTCILIGPDVYSKFYFISLHKCWIIWSWCIWKMNGWTICTYICLFQCVCSLSISELSMFTCIKLHCIHTSKNVLNTIPCQNKDRNSFKLYNVLWNTWNKNTCYTFRKHNMDEVLALLQTINAYHQ